MHLFRVVLQWTGPQVKGQAVTVLHFDGSNQSAPPSAGAIGGPFGAFMGNFPSGLTLTIPGAGDTIEDTTGELVGSWSTGNSVQTTGGGVATAAAGVGACVTWTTGGIVTGASGRAHRLRGRTFLVPLSTAAYQNDGTLSDTAYAALQAFGPALMGVGPLAIWHRPTTKGGTDGNSYAVLSAKARDKVAYLSSRRD